MTAWRPLLAAACLVGCGGGEPDVVILAAASTGDVVAQIAEEERAAGRLTLASVAASSVLARQIAHGAPADVFVTADPEWIDWLMEQGIEVTERRVVAHGRLVLVGPRDATSDGLDDALASASRVALADPSHVPGGVYAREALQEVGLWATVEDRVIPLGDVRAALAAVESGAADRAIVYASDAQASDRVRVVAEIPHAPIQFEVALLSVRGRAAFDALAGPASVERWTEAGFDPAPR